MTYTIDANLLDLLAYLKTEGYENLTVLDDGGIVGTHPLLYTVALHVDMDRHGYRKRYCYPTRDMARAAALAMKSIDDEPLAGYIASRGTV